MDYVFLLRKILVALCDVFRWRDRKQGMTLVMTIQAKNEEDVLEQNIRFHKAMGVDGFIITDNDSTDGTGRIIEKYKRKGWVWESILEKGKDHRQKIWVDRMIWLAKTKFGADWIIDADADEFWYTPSGNLKEVLAKASANVLTCRSISMYPEEGKPLEEWDKAVRVIDRPEDYGLSRYPVFVGQIPKVAHKAKGYIQISSGNHKVIMFPKRKRSCPDIWIYHYNIRGKGQFMRKMVDGGKALALNPSKHGGRHWRYFYGLHQQGLLEAEYDKVVGKNCYGRLVDEGLIYEDGRMAAFFRFLNREA